ncbi:DUF2510 domain-containing protein [Pauljensenia sp. UMB0018B]|uniref:DUF2510 domain-containing protein n=1 Tax=Schaalia odontolytica TaxID=1660 RepID=A0A2I1HYA9_9ACTO|nr:DUF2510 domain-containing protein [Schaalia odontolytica]MDK7339949.1 DUF2510 domain-containing protein [Pauljensenia sp. UMB0018B]PKY63865.1 hypothetical protein CYJ22_08955 [Schaalia odontolytica]
MSNPVQGWYADPAGTDQLRWWDGTQWTDRYQAAPASSTSTDSETPNAAGDAAATSETTDATAAETSPQPANATVQFTPVAQAPATKATRGQIVLAVVASIVTLAFLGSTIVATGMHGKAQEDLHRSQTILNEAKEQLQKVQEAIQ